MNLSELIAVFARVGTPVTDLVADIERLGRVIEPLSAADAGRAGERRGVISDVDHGTPNALG